MNNQKFIQFKRERNLGEMLSDAINFLGTEWKPFLGTIIKASIIPILIAICAMIYYTMSSTTMFGDLTTIFYNDESDFNFLGFFLPFLAFAVFYMIAYAIITVSALSYIKSYTENRGIVNFEEVNNLTKEKFGPSVGLLFLNGLIIGFGTLLCFLPGIYFSVVLSISTCLLIFQNKGVTESINDSFGFMKEHWWETFGIIIVVNIITGVISFIVNLPVSMYQVTDLGLGLQSQDSNELLSIFSDPIYLTLLVLTYFVDFLLYMVTIVVTVFIYCDIKEQHDPTVHTDVIDEIGIE